MADSSRCPGNGIRILPWADRIKLAVESWREWKILPTGPRMDRVFKDAGVRDLIAVAQAADAYLDRHQQMKGAVLTGGDFLLLAQAEDNLRDALEAVTK
ncbi:MAG: hypothetical protein V4529_17330 [Gemmatimonadota bacterium]